MKQIQTINHLIMCQLIIDQKKVNATEVAFHVMGAGEGKKMAEIKVYGTPTCPWCTKAKTFLKDKGIKFTDVDVSKDRDAAEEMMEKSGQMGVPVLDINGTVIVGFDQGAIEQALGE